jgi:hypothetical protein
VGGAVENVRAGRSEDSYDLGDGVLGQQHAAEDGLLGVQILRRDAFKCSTVVAGRFVTRAGLAG